MTNLNRHKFFLVQILKDIYGNIELANDLGFKGGTALMFFYNLPRFSIDLDFNLLNHMKEDMVFDSVRQIVLKYGKIHDEAKKHFGSIIVLDYGIGERKLKVEISNRNFSDSYEIKNFLGIKMKVMIEPDMFAHKLCALTDRGEMVSRDIFDAWFFMQKQTPLNRGLIEFRMKMPYQDYMHTCIESLADIKENRLLQGLGELMNEQLKSFVRTKLKSETIHLLEFYKNFPIE
jgi:predicted nucleotidyltransferase component of viral defense system